MKVYAYKNCDACRKGIKWLRERGVEFEEFAIRETPPSKTDLKAMLDLQGGELRKLFNTSGKDYRELGLKDRIADLSEQEAFELLSGNGNLVKRPFVLGDGVGLLGFKPEVWEGVLGA